MYPPANGARRSGSCLIGSKRGAYWVGAEPGAVCREEMELCLDVSANETGIGSGRPNDVGCGWTGCGGELSLGGGGGGGGGCC